VQETLRAAVEGDAHARHQLVALFLHPIECREVDQLGPVFVSNVDFEERSEAAHLAFEVRFQVGVVDEQHVRERPVGPVRSGVIVVRPERVAILFPGKVAARHEPLPEDVRVAGEGRERLALRRQHPESLVDERRVSPVVVQQRHEHVTRIAADEDVAHLREVGQRVEGQMRLHEAAMLLPIEPCERLFGRRLVEAAIDPRRNITERRR